MINDYERLIFARELGHLLSELEKCRDVQIKNIIYEHISLLCLALISISD